MMERNLPVFEIHGTGFLVDVEGLRLVEEDDPSNFISLSDMRDVGDGYVFEYNLSGKNIPVFRHGNGETVTVKIPEWLALDPEGMALKYGIEQGLLKGKTDFDLLVNQEALQQRLMGRLPTVDIEGHIFYVDIRMDMLRPHDDFLSKGIVFSQIDAYYSDDLGAYLIPYHPAARSFEALAEGLTSIPEHLVAISFPHESRMDPIGFNRKHGFDELDGLKQTNVAAHIVAKKIDWKDTGIAETIQYNLDKQQQNGKSLR